MSQKRRDKKDKKGKKDSFIGSKSVKILKQEIFDHYLSGQDVALVMFYDPKNAQSQLAKPHFVKAASIVKKQNVGFAAVNCALEGKLCQEEEIRDLPTLKLYSRGRYLRMQNPMSDYNQLLKIIDSMPILPPKPVRNIQFKI
ncbi:unnamed protein product [Candidula unifasciata]|uniref:Thioredoxin domain-containing protein n=1 Tax=Candidula unifasciata TaxID=100452 RepID=A0A8S3YPH6_9EUPU|nr:unnamed protein product [Candidula unifasciata]